ncbi:hypothetical protein XELAEV_18033966mg, partial [Xenopus laevis]
QEFFLVTEQEYEPGLAAFLVKQKIHGYYKIPGKKDVIPKTASYNSTYNQIAVHISTLETGLDIISDSLANLGIR